MRERAVLEAHHEDHGELEALGRVERHERHDSAAAVGIGNLVGIGHERDLLEEVGQGALGVLLGELPTH